ncbi:amino acid ABC transporter permease [Dolosicoccus paucivorans]|uniref:Amino acid ABC transporter permease n=1 Tax=Dolosicoccus paucivorans TaxID=84521 RepID=A0A2N6SQC5_9LACT|nr:ABC transporter permease [Dolosicoccus paucivorans]PMB84298.1 amino acid ABC transporter permease [Dolosicoccus paucivorans]PMC59268.1 amino acid ABC transporter permease [Dolosicoccus paucivorans]
MADLSLWEKFIYYLQQNGSYILSEFWRHFLMSIYGVLFAIVIGIPIGIFIAKNKRLSSWVISLANILQTIPSLAMLSLLMIGMGLGANTVIVTVLIYSLLPIIKNTYIGMLNLPPDLLDAATGVGMNKWQRLRYVELPLSLSVIMAGIRNALVMGVGITAIGSFIGAGGLGDIILRGTNVIDGGAIVLAGAVPTAIMAMAVDIGLEFVERRLTVQPTKIK